jgi:hypothetical protein
MVTHWSHHCRENPGEFPGAAGGRQCNSVYFSLQLKETKIRKKNRKVSQSKKSKEDKVNTLK